MPVSLSKGGNVNLSRTTSGLQSITVGLGWDARSTNGAPFDLDASALLLTEGAGGRFCVRNDEDFVFYNNLKSACGSVEHLGDNSTGDGDGDDEQIRINLAVISPDIVKLRVCVTIHDADSRRQNFGMVRNAFMRVVNSADGQEIARFDLSEDASTESAMIFGEIYLHHGEWKFKAVGQGFAGGLVPLLRDAGVDA